MIKSIVVYLALLAVIPMSMVRAHVGILAYYWFSFFVPQNAADLVEIGWAKVIFAAAVVSWIGNQAFRSVPTSAIMNTYLFFLVWTFITTCVARYPELAWGSLGNFAKVVLIYFMATAVFTTRDRLHAGIWIVVLTVGFWAIFGSLKVAVGGGSFVVSGPAYSIYGDNNNFAMWVLMTIPWCGYLMLWSDQRWVRIVMGISVPLMLLAMIGTNSRGGFVGVAAVGVVYLFFSRRKIFVVTMIAVLAGLLLAIVPQERFDRYFNRVETIQTYEEDESAQLRLTAWSFAIDRANLTFPLADGFDAFRGNKNTKTGLYREAHSIYFEVLGEHGWIGLFIFLLWLIQIGLKALQIYRRCRHEPELFWARDLGFMAMLSLSAYMSAGAFLSAGYMELLILISAFVICTDAQVRARLAERQRDARPAPGQGARQHAVATGRTPTN